MSKEVDYKPLYAMEGVWQTVINSLTHEERQQFVLMVIIAGLFGLLFGIIPPIIVGVILWQYFSRKVEAHKRNAWKGFAIANGWRYASPNPSEAKIEGIIPPSIFQFGVHSPEISCVIEVVLDEHTFNLYMYKFTVGYTKSSRDYYCTVADVRLQKSLPHLLLDNKVTELIRNKSGASQHVKLEGNFDDYFNLYIDEGRHIYARSIITPDVMQTLIDCNAYQDIEIHDNHLFFMFNSDQRTVAGVQSIFYSVEALADQIAHRARTIKL